jgi:hypothetical protein
MICHTGPKFQPDPKTLSTSVGDDQLDDSQLNHMDPTTDRNNSRFFRACLLGGTMGDALGAPIEFVSIRDIRKKFGPDGLSNFAPYAGRKGTITDDTQMNLFTAGGVLRTITRELTKGIRHPPSMLFRAYLRWLVTQGETSRAHEFESAKQ